MNVMLETHMTDHDLLVRIDEQVKGFREDILDVKLQAINTKTSNDQAWKEYKGIIDQKVELLGITQVSLQVSRAQIWAVAGVIALVVGWAVNLWKH